jgi:hypothetical protein
MHRKTINGVVTASEGESSGALDHLLNTSIGPGSSSQARIDGLRIGRLVGFTIDDGVPLVVYPGQPGSAALRARAMIDVHSAHFDRELALMFEESDPQRPVVIGCLHVVDDAGRALASVTGSGVQVEADSQRLVVSANEQIVLRCGKASITLTKEGKVIIQGAYVSNESTGVMRIQGGSVQIN